MIDIGQMYLFTYPNFGTPNGFPEYTAHSGEVVTVVRQLGADECDDECGPIFEVVASDGWKGYVDESELSAPGPFLDVADMPNSPFEPWERRGSQIYTEGNSAVPGTARLIAELHGLPNAVALAESIVAAHNNGGMS